MRNIAASWKKNDQTKIGVISDTNSYIRKDAINYLKNCNEIWHAGDIGNIDILKKLESVNTTRAVFGNIDNEIIRRELNKYLIIKKQNIVFLIIHIAGKPPNYNKKTRDLIKRYKPNVIICGHSHILKIDKDNIDVIASLSEILSHKGENIEAMELIDTVLEQEPSSLLAKLIKLKGILDIQLYL